MSINIPRELQEQIFGKETREKPDKTRKGSNKPKGPLKAEAEPIYPNEGPHKIDTEPIQSNQVIKIHEGADSDFLLEEYLNEALDECKESGKDNYDLEFLCVN